MRDIINRQGTNHHERQPLFPAPMGDCSASYSCRRALRPGAGKAHDEGYHSGNGSGGRAWPRDRRVHQRPAQSRGRRAQHNACRTQPALCQAAETPISGRLRVADECRRSRHVACLARRRCRSRLERTRLAFDADATSDKDHAGRISLPWLGRRFLPIHLWAALPHIGRPVEFPGPAGGKDRRDLLQPPIGIRLSHHARTCVAEWNTQSPDDERIAPSSRRFRALTRTTVKSVGPIRRVCRWRGRKDAARWHRIRA